MASRPAGMGWHGVHGLAWRRTAKMDLGCAISASEEDSAATALHLALASPQLPRLPAQRLQSLHASPDDTAPSAQVHAAAAAASARPPLCLRRRVAPPLRASLPSRQASVQRFAARSTINSTDSTTTITTTTTTARVSDTACTSLVAGETRRPHLASSQTGKPSQAGIESSGAPAPKITAPPNAPPRARPP